MTGHLAHYLSSLSGVTLGPGLYSLSQSNYHFQKCPGLENRFFVSLRFSSCNTEINITLQHRSVRNKLENVSQVPIVGRGTQYVLMLRTCDCYYCCGQGTSFPSISGCLFENGNNDFPPFSFNYLFESLIYSHGSKIHV